MQLQTHFFDQIDSQILTCLFFRYACTHAFCKYLGAKLLQCLAYALVRVHGYHDLINISYCFQ